MNPIEMLWSKGKGAFAQMEVPDCRTLA